MSAFSCLMSSYYKDSPGQLRNALDSLISQTLQASEIVIVEDGKLSEALYQVLSEYAEKLPIKRIQLAENQGLGNALNQGLRHCSYEIVMRMDSDDVCHPTRFEKQVVYLNTNPEVAIVGSWAKDIDNDNKIIGERIFPTRHEELLKIIWSCPLAHPTVAFRKHDILKIGSYRTDIKRRQDYDLWMRAAVAGLKFANIPEFLLFYRFTDNYYKKNNLKVAWSQTKMGLGGLKKLKEREIYPYFAVCFPIFRSILPNFLERPVHRMMKRLDPRKKVVR